MVLVVGPLAGFVVGLIVGRWRVVAAAAVVTIVLSAVGLPLGWFDTQDMEPLGGLIVMAFYFEFPSLAGLALGALVRRSLATPERGAFH